jgi:phosphoglycerate kinase
MKYNAIQELNLNNKTLAIRTDINVPIQNGIVQDNTRIVESFETIKYAIQNGAKQVIIIAHFGRPKGKTVPEMSLSHILCELEKVYGQKVELKTLETLKESSSQIVVLENIRFFAGEEKNDAELSKNLANIADFYINDAFGASHRAHASISGIAQYTKVYAGLLLQKEIQNIESIIEGTQKEKVCAIIGGSKVSTKVDLLKNLIHKAKYIILGGGMANTFLHAQGFCVGKSLFEPDFANSCLEILEKAKEVSTEIILPEFVVTAKEFKNGAEISIKSVKSIEQDDIIVDVSLENDVENVAKNVENIVWNGPLGAFEMKTFSCGTESVARIVAKHTALGKISSIIGGGDVVSAISSFGLKNEMTYISTGGGAFLELLEGKELPGISVCRKLFVENEK